MSTPAGSGDGALRLSLIVLAVLAGVLGIFGVVSPHCFYRTIPGVDMLGPYNQHLLSDVGGFYLAFAVVFAGAASSMDRALVRMACVGFLIAQTIHFIYHVTHLKGFGLGMAVIQTVLLGLMLAVPSICLWLSSRPRRDGRDRLLSSS